MIDYAFDPYLVEIFEAYIGACVCESQESCICASFEEFCETTIDRIRDEQAELTYEESKWQV